ncbi:hypothetical protein JMJ56_31360 [Belnapia sp. T18]|uniref:Uncharacterized protein n=1 Tax=Belnapia arida TaxID=2804533 RepID=A0ABS1UGQ5_9PROT|nr:hypothetical protein [Belnapia arida]MBL6082466.1 hypothetical protein [Belnapia arida]
MATEKLSRQQRERLADPATWTAMEVASGAGRAGFDYQLKAIFAEMTSLLAAQQGDTLPATDEVRLMALNAEFFRLSAAEADFVQAALASRLDPPDGSEMVDP